MKLLNVNPNTVNRVFKSIAGHSNAADNAILTACKYAVFFSLRDNNRERANQLLSLINKRYENIVKRYIEMFANLEYDAKVKAFVVSGTYTQPTTKEAIEAHHKWCLEYVSGLPSFDSLPKQKKEVKPLEKGTAEKAIKNTLLRLTRQLKDQDLSDGIVLNEAHVIHALESYMDNIIQGIALEQVVPAEVTPAEVTPAEVVPAEVAPEAPRVFLKKKIA